MFRFPTMKKKLKAQNPQSATGSPKTTDNQDKSKEPEEKKSNNGYVRKVFKMARNFSPFRWANYVLKTLGVNKNKSNPTNENGSSVSEVNTTK